jgi:NAD(P)-dependent dehydrogenase (short-subunit alcohol dehydrogenase family)
VLLKQDCRIAIADLDEVDAAAAARGLGVGEDNAIGLAMDVRSTESVNAGITQIVSRLGGIDILVNNAGTTTSNPVPTEETSDAEWYRHTETHLGGTFRCSRAAYPHLAKSGYGAIVSLSSFTTHFSIRERVPYIAAKSGIEALTRVLAIEWADVGIRVNAVAPGYIRTGRLESAFNAGLLDEKVLAGKVPMRRLGRAEEVATVIAFLCSDGASYVNGQTLVIDGGTAIDSGM